MTTSMLTGTYFNGVDAVARTVTVTIEGGRVILDGPAVSRDEPLGAVAVSEAIGRTVRFLRFTDDAVCQIDDVDALREALAGAGGARQDYLSYWEQNRWLVLVLAASLVLLAAGAYRYGIPAAARSAARLVPLDVSRSLSRNALAWLDGSVFTPTAIDEPTQGRLLVRHALLRLPEGADQRTDLLFRKGDALGANALTLPSGWIVVTDELIYLARSDDELMAVLAHEVGHAQLRHGLRSLIQSSVVSFIATWYLGDFSSLVATAPAALVEAGYSRDFEREADDFAARTLILNGLSPRLLADVLERMELASRSEPAGPLRYLSSHPATAERLDTLRRYDSP